MFIRPNLSDKDQRRLRIRAMDEGTTMKEIAEKAIREYLNKPLEKEAKDIKAFMDSAKGGKKKK